MSLPLSTNIPTLSSSFDENIIGLISSNEIDDGNGDLSSGGNSILLLSSSLLLVPLPLPNDELSIIIKEYYIY